MCTVCHWRYKRHYIYIYIWICVCLLSTHFARYHESKSDKTRREWPKTYIYIWYILRCCNNAIAPKRCCAIVGAVAVIVAIAAVAVIHIPISYINMIANDLSLSVYLLFLSFFHLVQYSWHMKTAYILTKNVPLISHLYHIAVLIAFAIVAQHRLSDLFLSHISAHTHKHTNHNKI